jgi:hypothetical protein
MNQIPLWKNVTISQNTTMKYRRKSVGQVINGEDIKWVNFPLGREKYNDTIKIRSRRRNATLVGKI